MANKAKHELYMRHYFMMRRCYDDTFGPYESAGALGLTVARRWHNFENFANDIEQMFGLPPGHRSQLARKNPHKGWIPSNIEGWTDHKFVANNRRHNTLLTYKGKTQSIADWGREVGIRANTLWCRYRQGYTVDQIFNKPINKGIKIK